MVAETTQSRSVRRGGKGESGCESREEGVTTVSKSTGQGKGDGVEREAHQRTKPPAGNGNRALCRRSARGGLPPRGLRQHNGQAPIGCATVVPLAAAALPATLARVLAWLKDPPVPEASCSNGG